MILDTRNVKLRIQEVGPATTVQRKIDPTLNVRHGRNVTHRNRLVIGFQVDFNFSINIAGGLQPRFEIIRRQATLENRRTRIQPSPRTEILRLYKTSKSHNRIGGGLHGTEKSLYVGNKKRCLSSAFAIFNEIPSGRRDRINLLIDIITIHNVKIAKHLDHVESRRSGNLAKRNSKTNGEPHIISQ